MRKLVVLSGLVFSTPILVAQHGAHMGGAGAGHAGISSTHVSVGRSMGRPAGIGLGSTPNRSMSSSAFNQTARTAYRQPFRYPYRAGYGADHNGDPRSDRHRTTGYGYPGVGWNSYGYVGYGYPLYGLDNGLNLDDTTTNDPNLQQNQAADAYAGETAQYADVQQPPYDDSYYAPSQRIARAPYGGDAATPEQPYVKVALVFKDGHRQEIQNYIATRSRIIVRDDGTDRTIPTSSLDIGATLAANKAEGNDFSLPGNPPPGQ